MPNFISYHPALDKERLNELISFPYIHKYTVFDIFKMALNFISLSLKSSAFSHCKYVFVSILDFRISNVTLNCQVTIIVTTSGFQLSKMLSMSQMCLESVVFSYMSQNKKWLTDSVTQ